MNTVRLGIELHEKIVGKSTLREKELE